MHDAKLNMTSEQSKGRAPQDNGKPEQPQVATVYSNSEPHQRKGVPHGRGFHIPRSVTIIGIVVMVMIVGVFAFFTFTSERATVSTRAGTDTLYALDTIPNDEKALTHSISEIPTSYRGIDISVRLLDEAIVRYPQLSRDEISQYAANRIIVYFIYQQILTDNGLQKAVVPPVRFGSLEESIPILRNEIESEDTSLLNTTEKYLDGFTYKSES